MVFEVANDFLHTLKAMQRKLEDYLKW